jgi:hypothetical protein
MVQDSDAQLKTGGAMDGGRMRTTFGAPALSLIHHDDSLFRVTQ